jgi:carrier protein
MVGLVQEDSEADGKEAPWVYVAKEVGVAIGSHPIEYAKVLIQIGYEPIAPVQTTTCFGKPALALPGILKYMGYMKRQVGFLGLYNGLPSRLCGRFTSNYVFARVSTTITIPTMNAGDINDEEQVQYFIKTTLRDSVARTAAVVASHPFQVITIRTMAQFIGGEIVYNGPLSAFKEIWKREGISGFFSGIVPRLLGELLTLWLASSFCFIINTYFVKDKQMQPYWNLAVGFIATSTTYSYSLVSNIMCVTDSGLAAGYPPHMPVYTNWTQCWRHLRAENQLKRGSSLFWRYYTGPQVLIRGQPQAVSVSSFKPPTRYA